MTKEYIGNCVNSFDEDGECIVSQLPWRDATDFAQGLEEAEAIEPFEIHPNLLAEIGNPLTYMVIKYDPDVYIAYDEETDIHYFFM